MAAAVADRLAERDDEVGAGSFAYLVRVGFDARALREALGSDITFSPEEGGVILWTHRDVDLGNLRDAIKNAKALPEPEDPMAALLEKALSGEKFTATESQDILRRYVIDKFGGRQ